MSFRRRGEIVGGSGARRIDSLGVRGPSVVGRARPERGSPSAINTGVMPPLASQFGQLSIEDSLNKNHPGVKPSPAASQQTTSTGSQDLDRLLGHMGLPLGTSLLIEEKTATEFNSILCKLFAAQGIVHNRVDCSNKIGNTHLIVVSLDQLFAKQLPGIYKGNKKDNKMSKIAEEESKLTVQNLTEKRLQSTSRYKDLRIAWRYKLTDTDSKTENTCPDNESEEHKFYSSRFDVTTRLLPVPTSQEISFISPIQPLQALLQQIDQVIMQNKGKLIRIVVPSLLHPAMYQPHMFKLCGAISLAHGLRSIVKKHRSRCVLLATVSADMLTRLVLSQLENILDAVLILEPFDQEMLTFLERAYKSQPNKVQHGLLHILKLPVYSERGEMRVARSEFAFKNGRKRFQIEEWGIPVEDDQDTSSSLGDQSALRNETLNARISESPESRKSIHVDY